MQQTLVALGKITGLPVPTKQIPFWLAMRVAELSELIAFFTGKTPQATVAGVRMAQHKMWFNPGKAIRELGLPQTPPEQAFTDAVNWFRANGYVKKHG
jgi:dihydroflavonol-4-reductase